MQENRDVIIDATHSQTELKGKKITEEKPPLPEDAVAYCRSLKFGQELLG